MQRESLVYLVAAGLFAAAAGITVGRDGNFGLGAGLLIAAALAMAWLAARKGRAAG